MDYTGVFGLGKGTSMARAIRSIVVNGLYPQAGLGTHPPSNGFASVKYRLNKKCAAFYRHGGDQ